MLPRSTLFFLLPATLLVLSSFLPSKSPAAGLLSEDSQFSPPASSQQFSASDKYSLRGMVVNSATFEPIRGALVQIYINGQTSMLTGSDGKFQFDGLPNGETTISV